MHTFVHDGDLLTTAGAYIGLSALWRRWHANMRARCSYVMVQDTQVP